MNERIRKLRRVLDMTQTKFADRIGLVQNTITGYERGRIIPSDQTILSICREFNVNEKWLRTGEGEMFNPAPSNELDALAKKYDLSKEAYMLIEKFLDLKKEQRDVIINFVKEAAAGLAKIESQKQAYPSANIDIDAEVEAYRRALELQKKAGAESSVMNGHDIAESDIS